MDFSQATASCPSECCNWVYPHSKRANLPVRGGDATCDGETTCREISQVCHLQGQSKTKTFSCPVGTMMQIEGGSGGGSKLTVGAGAQLVASPSECTITANSNTLVCPSNTVGQGGYMSAIVAADDCNCVTCDASGTNVVEEGLCSTPIPSYLHGEGICAPIYDNFCPPPIDRADEGEGRVIIGSQLNKQDQMKMYHSEIKTALDALEVAIQQGTLTPGERIGHVEAMTTGLANLEAAIQNARVYQIGAEESVLGMIDDMQGTMHLVQCFVSWGCMTTDGILLLLDTEKATLAQIEANFGSYNKNRSTGNNGGEGKKTDALSEFQRALDLLTDIGASIRFLELGIVHTGHSATEILPLFDPLNTHLAALHNKLATAVNYKPGKSLGPILGWILRTETDLPDLKCGLEGTCTITHDKMVDLVETAMLSVNLIGHYMVPPPES